MKDVRQELGRLIYDGLAGRTLRQLFQQLRMAFLATGEPISLSAFYGWADGTKFPATRKRQDLIAVVVGGPCGDAISKLPSPAFRGYRRRVATEKENGMTAKIGGKNRWERKYDYVSVIDEDGERRSHAYIVCDSCGTRDIQRGRRGKLEMADLFRAMGWETGSSPRHDFCPACVEGRKVVKMEDHKAKAPQQAAGAPHSGISGEDGRILSRFIEDHWDAATNRYMPGWSDRRLSEEVGRSIDHVKAIRERDFPGGVGEDPTLVEFLAATDAMSGELTGLKDEMQQLAAGVSLLSSEHDRVQRVLEKYRDRHNALNDKVKRLAEVASQLRPFEQKAG